MYCTGFLTVIISTVFFYLLGSIIGSFHLSDKFNGSFYHILVRTIIGFLATIFFYAIYQTGGNTILWGILIVVILFYYKSVKHKTNNSFAFKRVHIPSPGVMCVIVSLIFSYYTFYFFQYYNPPFHRIFYPDEVFYSYTSAKIGKFGIETFSYINSRAAIPYHYPELWLTDLLSSLFGLLHYFSLSIVVKVIFNVLLTVGMLSIAEHFSKKIIIKIFAVFSVFIAAIILDYSPIKQLASNAGSIKFSLASLFYIWFIILSLRKNIFWYFPLLILPIVNISFAPIVLPTLCILWIYDFCVLKKQDLLLIASVFFVGLYIALFYFLQPSLSSDSMHLSDIMHFYQIKVFNYTIYPSIVNAAMYIPYFIPSVILVIYMLISRNKQLLVIWRIYYTIIIYILTAFTLGLFLNFLLTPFAGNDSSQIQLINYVLILNVFVFISFLIVDQLISKLKIRILHYLFISIVLIYNIAIFTSTKFNLLTSITDMKDVNYITSVSNFIYKNNSLNGARIENENSISSLSRSSSRTELSNGYWFIPFCTSVDFLNITSITTKCKIGPDSLQPKHSIHNMEDINQLYNYYYLKKTLPIAPYSIFVDRLSMANQSLTNDSLYLKFIIDNNISFVVLENDAVQPVIFEKYIDTIFTDKISGEKFIFLKI